MRACRERRRSWVLPTSPGLAVLGMLGLAALGSGCGNLGGPPPTPVVVVVTAVPPSPVVVTATPEPRSVATATTGATAKPAVAGTPAIAGKPAAGAGAGPAQKVPTPVPSPTPTLGSQTLTVGRTNSYRGLLVTVDEVRS